MLENIIRTSKITGMDMLIRTGCGDHAAGIAAKLSATNNSVKILQLQEALKAQIQQ